MISLYYYNSLLGRVHYLCPIALINHNSFNEESPNPEGYDQRIVVWLGGPSRSLLSKVAFSFIDRGFFPRHSNAFGSCWGVMLSIPLRRLVLTLIDATCVTLIMSRGGSIVPSRLLDAYLIVLLHWLTTFSVKCPALTNFSK